MEPTTKPQYLSDEFTKGTFASMIPQNMYAFYSAPDSGKTTLVIHKLQPYLKESGKKALYLTSRRVILDQIKDKIDSEVVHCCTYQKVENHIDKSSLFAGDYDFIICDEAHYFVEDAQLSERTDLSFSYVNNSPAVVILMSGTPEYIECLKDQWNRPIVTLKDLNKANHNLITVCLAPAAVKKPLNEYLLEQHLEKLVQEQKRILVYDSNINDLYKLYGEFKKKQDELGINISFICSMHNKSHYKHCDKERLDILTATEQIDSDLLFITSALNTGVSINENYEYLFIFGNPSKTAIFQLIARVRRGKYHRKLKTVFCSVPTWSRINAMKDQLATDLLFVDDKAEWELKRRSRRLPVYVQDAGTSQNQYTYNRMILGKIRKDVEDYEELLSHGNMDKAYKALFEDRYANVTVTTLGLTLLVDLLTSYKDLPYLGKEQQDRIKSLCIDHNMQSSINKINNQLHAYGYKIRLSSDQKKIDGHKCQVWYIE